MWYDVDLTFSKGGLGWFNENTKVPELVLDNLEHLSFWHGQAGEGLEERDTSHIQVVAQLKAHLLLPLRCCEPSYGASSSLAQSHPALDSSCIQCV